MEIRFIWIQEYRTIIENLNVNFDHSGEHNFHYGGNILQLINHKKSPLPFGPMITGVTAIAGKNGSGKTSICEVILNAAATYVNGGWSWNFTFSGIICFGTDIYYSQGIVIDNLQAIRESGYTVQEFKESPFEQLPIERKLEYHKSGFIYYSNVLDWRSDIQLMNLNNISTQFLLTNDFRYSTGIIPTFDRRDNVPDILNSFYDEQGYRNVQFYLNFEDFNPGSAPTVFALKNTYSQLNRYLRYQTNFDYDDYRPFGRIEAEIIKSIQNIEYPISKEGDDAKPVNINQAKKAMISLYRFNLLMAIAIKIGKMPDSERAARFIFLENDGVDLFENYGDVGQLLTVYEELVLYGEISEEYSAAYLKYKYKDLSWPFFIIEVLWINNTPKSRTLLKSFIELEDKVIRNDERNFRRLSNYAMHPWQSTGEASFFNLFSRLYEAVRRYSIGSDERTNIVLFIDEGDVGFHPAWKKKMLNWLVEFLNKDFNQNYKFQIILTTHSPYLLSDLSSEHVILLNREKEGKTEIISTEKFKTFGANINELFSETFFLEDGLIGEYGKTQIQKVINLLNKWRALKNNPSPQVQLRVAEGEQQWCRAIIESIGEEILRRKLLSMYLELFDDERIVDHEINYLEERLKELRERRNQ